MASSTRGTAGWDHSARWRRRGGKSYSKDRYFQADVCRTTSSTPRASKAKSPTGDRSVIARQLDRGASAVDGLRGRSHDPRAGAGGSSCGSRRRGSRSPTRTTCRSRSRRRTTPEPDGGPASGPVSSGTAVRRDRPRPARRGAARSPRPAGRAARGLELVRLRGDGARRHARRPARLGRRPGPRSRSGSPPRRLAASGRTGVGGPDRAARAYETADVAPPQRCDAAAGRPGQGRGGRGRPARDGAARRCARTVAREAWRRLAEDTVGPDLRRQARTPRGGDAVRGLQAAGERRPESCADLRLADEPDRGGSACNSFVAVVRASVRRRWRPASRRVATAQGGAE